MKLGLRTFAGMLIEWQLKCSILIAAESRRCLFNALNAHLQCFCWRDCILNDERPCSVAFHRMIIIVSMFAQQCFVLSCQPAAPDHSSVLPQHFCSLSIFTIEMDNTCKCACATSYAHTKPEGQLNKNKVERGEKACPSASACHPNKIS